MPPSIPGLGTPGGFSFWLQDRSGGSVEFLDDEPAELSRGGAQAAGAARTSTRTFSAAVPQVFADVDRDKALKQGVAIGDVYQTLQAFLGGSLRQPVQPLRPAVARVPAGRRRRSARRRTTSASSTCATTTATWCRCRRSTTIAATIGPRVHATASTSIAPRRSPARRRPATARARRSTRSRRSRARRCRARWATTGRDLSYQEKKAPGSAARVFALSLARSCS